jgi:putative acyl-CoA dehydrogenase
VTHEVLNQPPPLEGYDVFGADRALTEGTERHGASWAEKRLHELGDLAGSAECIRWGFSANEHELHGGPWRDPRDGAHVARAAGFMVWSQVDAGHGCPISMTYAIVPALRAEPSLAGQWEPRLTSSAYDPRALPAREKSGAIAGMAMTEKQGGSDVRANTTRAVPANGGGPGAEYSLTGHKWFCSAPMSDAFLMLAQAPGGLSCFLVPRRRDDGEPNGIEIQRLKDKLGNRSNASSEIELDSAVGHLVGDEGRGVPTIIQMVNHTRLDCVLGASSGMRQAVVQALHHTAHRNAFGKVLVDQPLMRNVLADLAVESEAATTLALRLAAAYDATDHDGADPHEVAFARLATAVGKFWVCKRQPGLVAEALECLGGNGYIEDFDLARIYRELPLLSIWEGSGNVAALDALRAIAREPHTLDAFFGELDLAAGVDARYDDAVDRLKKELTDFDDIQLRARRIVELMALVFQGSQLLRHAPSAVADAFCASRLGRDWGGAFGTLPAGLDLEPILERTATGFPG